MNININNERFNGDNFVIDKETKVEGKIDFDELKAKAREMGINIEIN